MDLHKCRSSSSGQTGEQVFRAKRMDSPTSVLDHLPPVSEQHPGRRLLWCAPNDTYSVRSLGCHEQYPWLRSLRDLTARTLFLCRDRPPPERHPMSPNSPMVSGLHL